MPSPGLLVTRCEVHSGEVLGRPRLIKCFLPAEQVCTHLPAPPGAAGRAFLGSPTCERWSWEEMHSSEQWTSEALPREQAVRDERGRPGGQRPSHWGMVGATALGSMRSRKGCEVLSLPPFGRGQVAEGGASCRVRAPKPALHVSTPQPMGSTWPGQCS